MDNKIDAGPDKHIVPAKKTEVTEGPLSLSVENVDASFMPLSVGPAPMSKKERARRKKRRKTAQASKRRNR